MRVRRKHLVCSMHHRRTEQLLQPAVHRGHRPFAAFSLQRLAKWALWKPLETFSREDCLLFSSTLASSDEVPVLCCYGGGDTDGRRRCTDQRTGSKITKIKNKIVQFCLFLEILIPRIPQLPRAQSALIKVVRQRSQTLNPRLSADHAVGQCSMASVAVSACGGALSAGGATSSWLRQFLPGAAVALWDGLFLAAPKKKTSHAKKRMRMANKYLRPDPSVRRCDQCGGWKRPHNYCVRKCPGRF